MNENSRPKRTLLAYCALAQRLNTPGVGVTQALMPFFAEACEKLAGELFDAEKFSVVVAQQFGIQIPRLAALGLTEQLYAENILETVSQRGSQTIYRYAHRSPVADVEGGSPVSEEEIERILDSFAHYCAADSRLKGMDRPSLDAAFLDRLLNTDSMRILSRKEASISIKKSAETLTLRKANGALESGGLEDLHLDFMTSQFLLDLQSNDRASFELVSDVAFASMAAETIACFHEPLEQQASLGGLTVYLDSPVLLDMLGVNAEYADYGAELLQTIVASGAHPAVLDHCVLEAEAAITAQLAHLRSGVNSMSARGGASARPDLLNALSGNVGERAYKRLGISIERDPEINLHRRAQTTVGNIESEMATRMQHWGNPDAKEHDRKSVWSMLAIRDSSVPCPRICDSKWIFLSRNTALVRIANRAWITWLKGTTKHSTSHVDKWAPISMSDKQFAGYVWLRTGGISATVPRARLLANCSAAVRPRADVKARAYNLALELYGKQEADDLAALFEDREGARALMHATAGDPEDVTKERLPFIIEQVKLGAGEFAAARVREESAEVLRATALAHEAELRLIKEASAAADEARVQLEKSAKLALAQKELERTKLEQQNAELLDALKEQDRHRKERTADILQRGYSAGRNAYQTWRWIIPIGFALFAGYATFLSSRYPVAGTVLAALLTFSGFWFVPGMWHHPLQALATNKLRRTIKKIDPTVVVPALLPDFRESNWPALDELRS